MQEKRPSIAPFLSVCHSAKAIDFYKAAFEASEAYRFDDGKGGVVAQLLIGSCDFWVGDESPEHGNFSPETLGGGTVRMILVVDDPHAAYAQAISAGAKEICPVRDEPYGWRIGILADPFGHRWEIGRLIDSSAG